MEKFPDSSRSLWRLPQSPRRAQEELQGLCWPGQPRARASHLKQSDKGIRSKPMWKNTLAARLLNPITNSAESLPREFNNAVKMKCGLQKGAFVSWMVLSYLCAGQATGARGCTSNREEFPPPPLMQLSVIRTSFTANSF